MDFACAPPYHSSGFTNALLVVCSNKIQRKAFLLNVSSIEPQLGTSFDLPSPEDKVMDVSWGPEGAFYLLRTSSNNQTTSWRLESYRLEIYGSGDKSTWSVSTLPSFTFNSFRVTSFAIQSRMGGFLLGCDTGELYYKELDASSPRKITQLCRDAIQITKVKRDRLVACVSSTGQLSIAIASHASPKVLELCPNEVVATVSFSHELPTLAVGLAESPPRVKLFEYGWDSQRVVATQTRELVVFGPSLVEEERWLGGIKDLDFGTGSSVACLFHGRTEPIVFHATSGRRTTSGSANQRVGISLGSPSPSILGASPVFAHRPLATGPKNHSLTWVGSSLFYINDQMEICREGFSRQAAQAAFYRNDAVRFAVLGPDYCSLLSLEGNPRWTRFDCPQEYVLRHGPLTKVSIDDDRSRIAVAAKRGLCVFFAQSRKWKLFQSETLENRLVVGGLFFMPSGHLGLSAQINETEWEIQVLDLTDKRLDMPPVYVSGPLAYGAPLAVEFHKTSKRNLMFVLFPSGILVYEIVQSETSPLTLRVVSFVARPPRNELGFITHMALVPSKLDSVLPRCVLIDSAGRAVALSLETQESLMLAPTFRVADAWTKIDPTLGIVVWTVVDRGLKLWVPSLDPQGELYQSPIVDVGFPEVGALPVGSDEDAFVCFQSHLYDVRGSKSPVLHGILSWLLTRGRDGLARRVLAERRFSKSVRIVRAALEDLLQGALLGENQVEVRKVVNLLGCVPFEIMAAVVARCARQIDPQLWDVLFSIVGAPRDLFEQCLVRFDASHQPDAKRNELLLIAAELLPIVDADKDDPQDGPAIRAKLILKRCDVGSTLEKEIHDYADKRGLDISFQPGEELEDDSLEFFPPQDGNHNNGSNSVMSSVISFLSGF